MLKAIDPAKQDAAKEKEFLTKLATAMNDLKVMQAQVGVSCPHGGEITGFLDPNGNNVQDIGETKEFTVTIDAANNRLVASDNNGHHRPYGFSPVDSLPVFARLDVRPSKQFLRRSCSVGFQCPNGALKTTTNPPLAPQKRHVRPALE